MQLQRLTRFVLLATVAAVFVAACSEDQKRDVEGFSAKETLESKTKSVLDDNNVELGRHTQLPRQSHPPDLPLAR